ncbi:hypothetical protein DV737_g5185, partial [Chaetothyriales sp. CBS 132003]
MQGLRPNGQQSTQCRFCVRNCIYCDIWKLATLFSTRKPLSQRYAPIPSPQNRHCLSTPDSPRLQETFDWEPTEHMIEAQFQTQRARLASIMSICTVDGVDEYEGLRMAHARCLQSVSELLYQEKVLEETILRSAQDSVSSYSSYPSSRQSSTHRISSQDCGSANSGYNLSERRPSCVEIAL